MDALDLLISRDSALKLEAPGPNEDELDRIFASAVRAPDHGRLRPWQFVVIGSDRRERFGEVMADAMRRRDPSASADALKRERDKALRAPVIIVVAARVQKGHRIPEIEQIASASAAAQTIMLAAPALGYGAMWKTGDPAYDPTVKEALGLRGDDEIIGFLYVGTRVGGGSPAARPGARDLVSVWQG
ncbi:MAG: nitroreductase [Acetobacteraceae bacterium]